MISIDDCPADIGYVYIQNDSQDDGPTLKEKILFKELTGL